MNIFLWKKNAIKIRLLITQKVQDQVLPIVQGRNANPRMSDSVLNIKENVQMVASSYNGDREQGQDRKIWEVKLRTNVKYGKE